MVQSAEGQEKVARSAKEERDERREYPPDEERTRLKKRVKSKWEMQESSKKETGPEKKTGEEISAKGTTGPPLSGVGKVLHPDESNGTGSTGGILEGRKASECPTASSLQKQSSSF